MSVVKDSESDGVAKFTINNGDLKALNRIKEQYGLNDGDDVLTFAIGALGQAEGQPLTIQKPDGTVIKFTPADQLKRTK